MTKYVTDDKKMMQAIDVVESMIEWYGQTAFDRSGFLTLDEQLYALREMIAHLQGLKNIFEGKDSAFYDFLNE